MERDDWRGFSRFRQALEDHGFRTASVRYLPSVEEMNQSVLIVGGMSRRYSDGELAAVLRFHERGGVLVVFDDTGMSNQILERITTMRINGSALVSRDYEKNSCFLRARAAGNMSILMDCPGYIESPQGTVLANTSHDSWVDLNGNLKQDIYEPSGAFPVAVYSGDLKLLVFSDSSLIINSMLEREDNLDFVLSALENAAGGRKSVLFEEATLASDSVPSAGRVVEALSSRLYMNYPLDAALLLVMGTLTMYISVRWRDPPEWFHICRAFEPRLYMMRGEALGPEDVGRVRKLILEYVRLRSGKDAPSREDARSVLPMKLYEFLYSDAPEDIEGVVLELKQLMEEQT